MKDKKDRTCLLIDMSIPTKRNTSSNTVEMNEFHRHINFYHYLSSSLKISAMLVQCSIS